MPRRHRRATRLATQVMELGVAVPEVMARRVFRMALAGPSPSAADREEWLRMGAEKVSAFDESWNEMLLAVYRANLQLSLSAFAWWSMAWPGHGHGMVSARLQRAALDMLASGVAPIHRRAVRNAKRLRR